MVSKKDINSLERLSNLESKIKCFRNLGRGTLVEITLSADGLQHTTSGYLAGMKVEKGERYVILNRYKNNKDDPFEIVSNIKCPIKLIKSYTAYP